MSGVLVTIASCSYQRADWYLTVKHPDGRLFRDEIRGDEGEAAAAALRYAVSGNGGRVVACRAVLEFVPKEYGGLL